MQHLGRSVQPAPSTASLLWGGSVGLHGAELPVGSGPAVGLKPLKPHGHPVASLQEIIWNNVKGQGSRKRAGDIGRVLEVAVKVKGAEPRI